MKADRVLTPEEFLCAVLESCGAVRRLPPHCHHGVHLNHPCKLCEEEINEILRVH